MLERKIEIKLLAWKSNPNRKPLVIKGTEKGALFIRRSTSFSIMLKNLAFHYSGIVGPPTRKEKYLLSDGYGSYNSLHIHHNRRQIGL